MRPRTNRPRAPVAQAPANKPRANVARRPPPANVPSLQEQLQSRLGALKKVDASVIEKEK